MPPRPDEVPAAALMTAEEVAALLRVEPKFVYRLAREGRMPAVRIGPRYVRFRRSDVEEWLAGGEPRVVQVGGR